MPNSFRHPSINGQIPKQVQDDLLKNMPISSYVYILSNKNRTTFYIGVTNEIRRRVLEHKAGVGSAFCYKYNLTDLMFYQKFDSIEEAIANEKRYKNWHRDWKINLIKQFNPEMKDAAKDWFTPEEIENAKKEYKKNKK